MTQAAAKRGEGSTEGEEEGVKHAEDPRVPALVLQVEDGVHAVAHQQRHEQERQIPERNLASGSCDVV